MHVYIQIFKNTIFFWADDSELQLIALSDKWLRIILHDVKDHFNKIAF